jgi:hypothetical protein
MPDQHAACLCTREPYRRFYGDHPRDFPEMVIDMADRKDPPCWILHCSHCGTGWKVSAIPYGGIYGDFEWERIEA